MAPRGRRDEPERDVPPPGFGRAGTRALEVAENLVYGGIVIFLLVSAAILMVAAAKATWTALTAVDQGSIIDLLDVLLLIFIVVELLFAVRTTIQKRELVAEPFLLVGIIASIKEIVVLSVEAAGATGEGEQFLDRMIEIGVLGVLVLLLGVTALLLRRKEREPDEAEGPRAEPRPAAGASGERRAG